jgi:hypothetical protein
VEVLDSGVEVVCSGVDVVCSGVDVCSGVEVVCSSADGAKGCVGAGGEPSPLAFATAATITSPTNTVNAMATVSQGEACPGSLSQSRPGMGGGTASSISGLESGPVTCVRRLSAQRGHHAAPRETLWHRWQVISPNVSGPDTPIPLVQEVGTIS